MRCSLNGSNESFRTRNISPRAGRYQARADYRKAFHPAQLKAQYVLFDRKPALVVYVSANNGFTSYRQDNGQLITFSNQRLIIHINRVPEKLRESAWHMRDPLDRGRRERNE